MECSAHAKADQGHPSIFRRPKFICGDWCTVERGSQADLVIVDDVQDNGYMMPVNFSAVISVIAHHTSQAFHELTDEGDERCIDALQVIPKNDCGRGLAFETT